MARLTLRLFGDFAAFGGEGEAVEVSARKGRGLLAYLALQGGMTAPRERLASLLWSDRGEAQARSSLRQTLAVLRKELGDGIIGGDDERVELLGVTSDVGDFQRLRGIDLEKAAGVYGGEFLADAGIGDPAFEEWLRAERQHLGDLLRQTLEKLLPQLAGEERVAAAKRLVALDPLREASHLALMAAHADHGDRAQALAAYSAARDVLKKELGISPGSEIEDLRQSVQSSPALERAVADRASIVVLPFANLSGDPAQQYLSDGITEDIIIMLSRFSELRVATRTAAMAAQGDASGTKEAAKLLGAQYAVKGTARGGGNRLIISCQLIDAQTGNLLWGERYDRDSADLLAVQDELVARIVTALGGRLVAAGASSSRRKPTSSWSAYEYFLQGRELCNTAKEAAAEPFFARAIELDPNFALAHAWRTIGLLGKFWHSAEPLVIEAALASAERALALDASEAMAHYGAGVALDYLRNHSRSEFHFRRALELNPLDANIRADHAAFLLHSGDVPRALTAIEEVMRRDPYPAPWMRFIHGQILFHAGQFDEAIRALDNGSIYSFRAHGYLAAAHSIQGRPDEARRHVELMRLANPAVTFQTFFATEPYATPNAEVVLRDGLRKAGFED